MEMLKELAILAGIGFLVPLITVLVISNIIFLWYSIMLAIWVIQDIKDNREKEQLKKLDAKDKAEAFEWVKEHIKEKGR